MLIPELRRPLLLLAAVLSVGVLGFRIIEGWTWIESMWMALITMTTIGFGEVHPLSPLGRVFGMVYILAAVGTGGHAVAQLSAYIVEGRFIRDVRKQQRARHMKSLRNHYIVVGYGRLGREVVEDLRHHRASVVVVDNEAHAFEHLGTGVLHLRGDGSSDEVLREAGIEHARALAIATPSTAVNVYITLSARQLNPNLYISTRVEEQGAEERARARARTPSSRRSRAPAARWLTECSIPMRPNSVEQLVSRRNPELVLDDIRVGSGSALRGRLVDLRLRERFGVAIIAIRHADGRMETVPGSQASLDTGDVAVVAGSEDAIMTLRSALEGG